MLITFLLLSEPVPPVQVAPLQVKTWLKHLISQHADGFDIVAFSQQSEMDPEIEYIMLLNHFPHKYYIHK